MHHDKAPTMIRLWKDRNQWKPAICHQLDLPGKPQDHLLVTGQWRACKAYHLRRKRDENPTSSRPAVIWVRLLDQALV